MTDPVIFTVKLPEGRLLLPAVKLAALVELIGPCEMLVDHWVGSGNGVDGSSYVPTVRPVKLDSVQCAPIMADTIDTLRLATKLYDEDNKRN